MIPWSTSHDFLPFAMTFLVGSFGLTSLTLLCTVMTFAERGAKVLSLQLLIGNSIWEIYFIISLAACVGFYCSVFFFHRVILYF